MTKQLTAGVTEEIKLRLKKRQLRALRAALAAGKRPKLRVTVDVTDAAGNAVAARRTVKARR